MNRRSQRQMQLLDSYKHGNNCELFIVEGESAANSVSALCDRQFQAVLPLQGKPLNAHKATKNKVNASPLHVQFAMALGLKTPTAITQTELANLNFGNIYLLFDPDADGIHIGALVLMYIQKWLPELIAHNKVHMIRLPMFSITSKTLSANTNSKKDDLKTEFAYLPEQFASIKKQIEQNNGIVLKTQRYQSVGSVPANVLHSLCIDPATRKTAVVDGAHINAVLQIFG